MKKITSLLLLVLLLQTSSAFSAEAKTAKGVHCLFIGHSFFIPVARRFPEFAKQAGVTEHTQQGVFSGGKSGAPGSLWANEKKKAEILAFLKTGKVELLGMTYYNEDNSSIDDYKTWIDEALKHNPKTEFFIGLPWGTNGAGREVDEYVAAGNKFHETVYAITIVKLRKMYPNNKIRFTYYGQASSELKKRFESGKLPELKQLMGTKDAIYRDRLGHANAMLLDLAAVVWLSALYEVDIDKAELKLDYQADLKAIAKEILANEKRVQEASAASTR